MFIRPFLQQLGLGLGLGFSTKVSSISLSGELLRERPAPPTYWSRRFGHCCGYAWKRTRPIPYSPLLSNLIQLIAAAYMQNRLTNSQRYLVNAKPGTVPGQNGDIPKRRQTKTAKVKTATRNGCTVRGLQALISCIVKPLTCSELYYFCIRCR